MSLSSLVFALSVCGAVAIVAAGRAAGAAEADEQDARARRFIDSYQRVVRPLEIGAARSNWTANITGTDEDFRKKEEIETQLDVTLSDPAAFAELKAIHEHLPADPLLRRQIEVLYLDYLPKQVEPKLLKQMQAESNLVEQTFNVNRPAVGGREMTDNEVRRILITSKDSAQRRAAWEASKRVGREVEPHLKRLVKLRNENAHKLGFKNYHIMQLYLNEQSTEQVLALFDELDALTRGPYRRPRRSWTRPWRGTAASRRPSCAPGTISIPSSRKRPACSARRPTRSTRRWTSPGCAAISMRASACRWTTCCAAAIFMSGAENRRTPSAPTSIMRAMSAC